MKKITYKFEHGTHQKLVRFNEGKDTAPKTGIASVKSMKQGFANQLDVPVQEIKVIRIEESL